LLAGFPGEIFISIPGISITCFRNLWYCQGVLLPTPTRHRIEPEIELNRGEVNFETWGMGYVVLDNLTFFLL
jgi:hypothetical protein